VVKVYRKTKRTAVAAEENREEHRILKPDESYKEAAFCSMCGRKFCSMNYSSKVDEYNEQLQGLEKKNLSELVGKLVEVAPLVSAPKASRFIAPLPVFLWPGSMLRSMHQSVAW
jgi:hypothetical protein